LTLDEPNLYYLGFSNRTLWPLFHTFPERIDVRHDTFRAYQLVNERFAAVELTEATQVNPYDTDGTAEQLYQAVRMPHTERVRRWRSQMNAITENTARSWGEGFSQELQLS
jgi:trehalose-6-phosphate synthase